MPKVTNIGNRTFSLPGISIEPGQDGHVPNGSLKLKDYQAYIQNEIRSKRILIGHVTEEEVEKPGEITRTVVAKARKDELIEMAMANGIVVTDKMKADEIRELVSEAIFGS